MRLLELSGTWFAPLLNLRNWENFGSLKFLLIELSIDVLLTGEGHHVFVRSELIIKFDNPGLKGCSYSLFFYIKIWLVNEECLSYIA